LSAKAKGARRELQTKELLELTEGYKITKSGGSLGEWDLVGFREDGAILVQVKSNHMPGPEERDRLETFECGSWVRKEIWVWIDRKGYKRLRLIGREWRLVEHMTFSEKAAQAA